MNNRWKTGRPEAFSDGVFAIAITPLVLEMDMPDSGFEHLWKGIAGQWPSHLAYATSFLTIGVTWLHHHLIFRRTAWLDSMVMRLNMLVLMLIAFLPFPTMLMARTLDKTDDAERVAVVLRDRAARDRDDDGRDLESAARRELLELNVTGPEVRAAARLTVPSSSTPWPSSASRSFAPKAAVFGYLLVALVALFREHGRSTTLPRTANELNSQRAGAMALACCDEAHRLPAAPPGRRPRTRSLAHDRTRVGAGQSRRRFRLHRKHLFDCMMNDDDGFSDGGGFQPGDLGASGHWGPPQVAVAPAPAGGPVVTAGGAS